MQTNCVVGGCSRTSDDKSASFDGFPSKSKQSNRRQIFVRGTRKDFTGPGALHNNNIKICDAHFADAAFIKRYQLAENWAGRRKVFSQICKEIDRKRFSNKGTDEDQNRQNTFKGDQRAAPTSSTINLLQDEPHEANAKSRKYITMEQGC